MRNTPSDLLAKIREQNQTIYNNANPKMSIQVSRAKTTVTDSTYWTVETIRTKAGLGDLSIAARRFKPYGGPNRLYNIYVDNGVVKTAIREYPDYTKEKWKDQFSLGNGSAVAIAFDGHWEWYRGKWNFVSDETPHVCWVDNNNKIQWQLWGDESTRVELASNALKVKMLRGWKTLLTENRDQGIVVAYIKNNGKIYYRQYIQYPDLSYSWTSETELTDFVGAAQNLNLFLTNDYRLGFAVEDSSGKIFWYVTYRNWSGMATGRDVASLHVRKINIDLEIGEIETKRYDFNDTAKLNIMNNITILAMYEAGQTPPTQLNPPATGSVINKKKFFIEFKRDIQVPNIEILKYSCPLYEINNVVVEDRKIYFETVADIQDTHTLLGFNYEFPSGLIIDIVNNRPIGLITTFTVKLDGNIPPVSETAKLNIDNISINLALNEITTLKYDIPTETATLNVANISITLTMTETSTDPI